MKVLLYGPFGQYPQEIEKLVQSLGIEIVYPEPKRRVDKDPDVVVTYGGDGTILGAEAAYPGIPKLPLRHSEVCFHCSPLTNDKILEHLVQNRVTTKEYLKIEASFKNKKYTCLNEFAIRNKNQISALRFTVSVNGEPICPEPLIGDGIVVSTPFGSTGYYFSIVRNAFTKGFGLAFNNIRNFEKRSILLPENATAEIEITRGPGLLSIDNSPEIVGLTESDKISIAKSRQTAKLLIPPTG